MRFRSMLLWSLVGALALAPLDASAAKKKSSKAKSKPLVQTGDPIPTKSVKDALCKDEGAHRWLGHAPITPMATVTKKGTIRSAGQHCCAPWATKGTRFVAVDAYGQPSGTVAIEGGEGYDVTQCYELSLKTVKGSVGAGIYVDEASGWKPPKSLEWKPSDKERASLAKLVSDLERAFVPSEKGYKCSAADKVGLPIAQRSLFFAWKPKYGDGSTVKQVVVGGNILVVATLFEDEGRWVVRHLDSAYANDCLPKAYRPLAAFDMNGDGVPEIVFHEDFADSWSDEIIAPEDEGFDGRFRSVASGVHGATA
jgi:hypothetical protein